MKKMHVIKASAGSGKTYTLAKKYIEQLLWSVDNVTGVSSLRKASATPYHEHILAITFTNKATDEMKSRIVKELYKLSCGKSGYMKDFLREHPHDDEDAIKKASKSALEAILFNYTTFNVSTIDSFFQVILRTFARELDRDYNYEIQLDDKYAIHQAVHDFMVDMGEGKIDKNLSRWVRSFIQDEVENQGDWNFFGQGMMGKLLSFAFIINKENFRAHHEEILNYLSDVGSGGGISAINKFKQAVATARNRHQDFCDHFGDTLRDFFIHHSFEIDKIKLVVIKKLLEHEELTSQNINTLNDSSKTKLDEKVFRKGTFDVDEAQEANDEFQTLLQDYVFNIERVKFFDSLSRNVWRLGLLGQIDEKLTQFRKDNNSILLADTNELIAKVLESGVDFVYERVGTWINHFMIDEFQDTSRKQYENFRPLLEESLSAGNDNLIIGDEKQCIYRFRNSDPDLLQSQLRKDFAENYDDSQKLEVNYRSLENIIKFNNDFFKELLGKLNGNHQYPKLHDTYENLHQKYSGKHDKWGKKGYVSVHFIYDGKQKDLPSRRDEDGEPLLKDEQVLHGLPRYILKIKKERHFEFKDILILVNTHDEGNKVVRRLLEHNMTAAPDDHIELVSSESLLLKNSPSVRLIMSVLRFIDTTQYSSFTDDGDRVENLAETSYDDLTPEQQMLKRRLAEQYRYQVLHDFGKELGQKGEDADAGEVLLDTFAKNAVTLAQPIDSQVKRFVHELEKVMPDKTVELTSLQGLIDKIIKEYLVTSGMVRGSETAFLLAFQGFVSDFLGQRNCGGTIHEFIKFWDSKKEKLAVPSGNDDNAIGVMTIHASKGLEAPCVIIPFTDWEMIKPDLLVWLERELWLKETGKDAIFNKINFDEDGQCIVPPLIPVEGRLLAKSAVFDAYYNDIIQENLIDKVNKTYVAFTRACQELHLFAKVDKVKLSDNDVNDECDTIGGWLFTLMPQLQGVKTVKWNETQDEDVDDAFLDYCELGTPEDKWQDDAHAGDDAGEATVEMPDYMVNSALPLLKVKLPELVSDDVKDEGVRMHRLFSYIHRVGDEKRALTLGLRRHLIQENGYWTQKRVVEVFDTMFLDERTKDWFAPENKVYNERPFLKPMTGGNHPIADRPDRLVKRPDGEVLVIDYKFGEAHEASLKRRYERQVHRYMQLLVEAGYERVRGFLWYLRLDEVVHVDFSSDVQLELWH